MKVLDEDGGSFADIGLGIRYAADQGGEVVNLSLGALPGVQVLTSATPRTRAPRSST